MDKKEILHSLDKKSDGTIYLGVVGAVRTGKSTFIKKCIENLILPYMDDEIEKKRCMDEIPQTASGKTIMTIEPKFVPSNKTIINVDGLETSIKLVDCVGYVTPESNGYMDDLGNPRMVKTPWFNEELPFVEAAEIGTHKVIQDHATIGIVITTDGSFGEMPRNNFISAEEKVIDELKGINKPFIVVLNSSHPNSEETILLKNKMSEKYNVPVLNISVENMNETDITNVLKEALYEFPVDNIVFNIPDWVGVLNNDHPLKKKFLTKMKESIVNVNKLRDAENININLEDTNEITKAYISSLDTDNSEVTITMEADDQLYNDILKEVVGESINSKGDLIKIFRDFSEGRSEYNGIKGALKQVYQTGYGIVLPSTKDMKLDTPEVIKQGGRYGIKLKAKASSVHMIKVDVESSFEPIIGSESQSKELIDHLLTNNEDMWKSEIFGRSLEDIVQESIQAKLSTLPETSKVKLEQTITKMVNKGSNNLIAIVL